MKNAIILAIIFIVLTMVGSYIIMYNIESYIEEKQRIIGKKIVLDNDTLLIIDYSIINDVYTLDNKLEINSKLADSLIIK